MKKTIYVKIVNNIDNSITFTISENITGNPVIDLLTATLPNKTAALIYLNGLYRSFEDMDYIIAALDQDTVVIFLEILTNIIKSAEHIGS